ncbi:MAG: AIM24 family protein [Lachnospiraceae bacterium]|nr:AIM24 family protein [Lachnospiraceae bacterium]MBQ4303995.1 AIM24 family protein [Lachnospiraceae bacterium]
MKIVNFQNDKRKITAMVGNLSVLEYLSDTSVSPANAEREYFMSRMGVRKRQVVCKLDGKNSIITQAGAMQWTGGNVQATSGIKGVGDLFGKMVKGAVTKESAVKPEYVGQGILVLEPTYKYIILEDISRWPSGMTIEDGMFLACEGTVKNKVVARRTLSSAALGNEGLFNLSLYGTGAVALESNVPAEELIEIELDNDELKIDGDMAVCWSTNLDFTVERSSKTLLGSAINGEGLVNVYRGTGRVLMSPVAVTHSLAAAAAPTPLKGR